MSAADRSVGLAALTASIVLSAAGQLAMKVGMSALHGVDLGARANADWSALGPALTWTAFGLASYVASMLAWLLVLARYPLSYAYPLLSVSYVLVYAVATWWSALGETATPLRALGTLLVAAGVALVSSTRAERSNGS